VTTSLQVLDRDACLRRLGRGGIGRVAFSDGGRLAILPVNFVLVDGDIVIRTSTGAALYRAALSGDDVAFEVDELDPGYRGGRSVLARGHLTTVDATPAAARALHPWGNAAADVFVSIAPTEITGRRICTPEV